MTKIFVAYAGSPESIGQTIERVKPLAKTSIHHLELTTWKRDDLGGQPIIQPVLDGIRNADVVIADVTVLNFNVAYELGFGLGLGKRVIPVHNRAYELSAEIQRIGIFDTLLRQEYSDAEGLFRLMTAASPGQRMATAYPFNPLPLYILLPEVQGDDFNQLEGRAQRAGLKARTFDPEEESRLPATDAIRSVASSYGIVIPLLAPDLKDARVHNIRACFVAGIAHALDRPTLILQSGKWDAPLDIRDEVSSFSTDKGLSEVFSAFAERVHDLRYAVPSKQKPMPSSLSILNLGDPAAENEESQLDAYFLERAEYRQITDGRVNIVVGRKGSGKTAVFVHSRDRLKGDRSRVVVDLSPKAHQLIKLKDLVLECLSAGSKEYLLSAFWEYVLLLEITSKILDRDLEVHKRNHQLFEPYQRLLRFFREDPVSNAVDFSDRLAILIERVAGRYSKMHGIDRDVVLSHGALTNILYETTLADLRREIELYSSNKNGIHVLFDNVDKGWNAEGLEDADVIMVRTLVDAGRKLQNDFRRAGTDFHCAVFLRNDIYELMVSATPDRGKDNSVLVDWSQAELLKQMIRRRLLFNAPGSKVDVDALWHSVCVAVVDGGKSLDYLIGRSLMRPRYLLRLIGYCIGNAINFDRNRVEEDDIAAGLSAYSTYIITEIDLEVRDVLAEEDQVLYLFLGEKKELTRSEIMALLSHRIADSQRRDKVFELLLWHGVIGLKRTGDEVTYIYDVNYDAKRLLGLMDKAPEANPVLQINPGFWAGLELV